MQHEFYTLDSPGFACVKCGLWVSQAQWKVAVTLEDCPGTIRSIPTDGVMDGLKETKMQPATCASCQYSKSGEGKDGDYLICRRFPPIVTEQWPYVTSADYCGEYSPGFDVARDMAG